MARRLSRAGTGILLATLALAVASCGGHAPTRRGTVARANAICASATSDARAVPTPTGGSPAALARYLRRVTPIADRELAQLRALPDPAGAGAQLRAFVAAEAAQTTAQHRLARAARGGDASGVQSALGALQSSRAPALARRLGAIQCAGSVATVR